MINCGFGKQTIMVLVDKTGNLSIKGKLINPYIDGEIKFSDYGSLMINIENIYNTINFPISSLQIQDCIRDKSQEFKLREECDISFLESFFSKYKKGEKHTLFIHTVCRNNASWQGYIVEKDIHEKLFFRSAIECIMKIGKLCEANEE